MYTMLVEKLNPKGVKYPFENSMHKSVKHREYNINLARIKINYVMK